MLSWLGLLKLALVNLRINKLRSGLTVLGMVFGTAAVIATLSSNEGASQFVREELKKIGVNTLTVRSNPGSPPFSTLDGAALKKHSEYVESVHIVVDGGVAEARRKNYLAQGSMMGVEGSFFSATKQNLARGRFFDPFEQDNYRLVAVLGSRVAQDIFGKDVPLNEWVHLFIGENAFLFQVVGVLKEKGGQSGAAIDGGIFIPYKMVRKLIPAQNQQNILLATLFDEETSSKAKPQILSILKSRFPLGLEVSDAREAIERNKAIWDKQNLVGICLALISLVTGGVGIMNIMLLSVSQRRKEVGLRKAVGANHVHILVQFLLEAMVVCILGGILGIGLGLLFGQRVASLMGQWNAAVSLTTVLMAIGSSMLTGVIFGIFPALRAARLDPYEALRT